jgi:uncharacterized protein
VKTLQTTPSPASPSHHDGTDTHLGERLLALDVVRGVAVLGILAANIIGMGQPMVAYGWPGGFLGPAGPYSDWLWGMQLVFVDGKFRGLFTLLFGAGMVLFLRSAENRGEDSWLLARRLAWLGLFGFLHWALLWRGDILLTYAVAGLVATPFLSRSARKQFALGLTAYLVGAAMLLAIVIALMGIDPASWRDVVAGETADGAREAAIMASADYGAWVQHSWAHVGDLPVNLLWALFETLPLLLIGMSLVGAGVFDGRADPRAQQRWGFVLWVTGTAATGAIAGWALRGGISYEDSLVVPSWSALPAIASSLGLMALLALWGRTATGWLSRKLADAGRCAFTNYIGTSALALAVFSGWGLDLFGKLGRLELYGVMLVFWLVMLAWPGWWLARYRHGPLEWLWRCLTHGRRLPLARSS